MRLIPLIAFLGFAGFFLSCSTSKEGGGSALSLAEAMCQQAMNCRGGPEQMIDTCIEGTSLMLDPLASIISAGAAQCIADASCGDLEEMGEVLMAECTGVDASTGECVDPTTLKLCNAAGVCAEVDCKAVCQKASLRSTASCGPSEFGENPAMSTCLCSESTGTSPP